MASHRYESRAGYTKAYQLWPGFWEWGKYLLRTHIEQNPCDYDSMPEPEFKTIMLVFRVIGSCCRDQDVRHQMYGTPGLLETLTVYWLHEEHHARIENLEMFGPFLGQFLDRCLLMLHDKPDRELERCCVHICHLLIFYGCGNGGAHTVIQALECGYIPGMLGSARFMKRMSESWIGLALRVFDETFLSYLTNRSVVRVVARQVEVCIGIEAAAGPLKEFWGRLKYLVIG